MIKTSRAKRQLQIKTILAEDSSDIFSEVNSLSFSDKVKIFINFVKKYSSLSEAINVLLAKAEEVLNQLPQTEKTTTASLSKAFGRVSLFFWVMTFLIGWGAADASDFNDKYFLSDPQKVNDIRGMLLAFTSAGAGILTTILSKYYKKQEDAESAKLRNRMYQGPRKL